jgi:hypothetical protein
LKPPEGALGRVVLWARRLALPLIVLSTAPLTGCSRDSGWRPEYRIGQDSMTGWDFEGCTKSVVDGNYVGNVEGYICSWSVRESSGWIRYREEGFGEEGRPIWVFERFVSTEGENLFGPVYFEESGELRYRVRSPAGESPKISYLDVLDDGRVVSVYRTEWASGVSISDEAEIRHLPMDLELSSGSSWPAVERFHEQQARDRLADLRAKGVDVSKRHTGDHVAAAALDEEEARAQNEFVAAEREQVASRGTIYLSCHDGRYWDCWVARESSARFWEALDLPACVHVEELPRAET